MLETKAKKKRFKSFIYRYWTELHQKLVKFASSFISRHLLHCLTLQPAYIFRGKMLLEFDRALNNFQFLIMKYFKKLWTEQCTLRCVTLVSSKMIVEWSETFIWRNKDAPVKIERTFSIESSKRPKLRKTNDEKRMKNNENYRKKLLNMKNECDNKEEESGKERKWRGRRGV